LPAALRKIFATRPVDNLVHNPVEIFTAPLAPPRAALAPIAGASFLGSRGTARQAAGAGLCGTPSLR